MFTFISVWGIAILVAFVLAIIVAKWKNRDVQAWAFISFIFPPAVLLLLFIPAAGAPPPRRLSWEERERREYAQDEGDRVM
jgi:hypothetical protein